MNMKDRIYLVSYIVNDGGFYSSDYCKPIYVSHDKQKVIDRFKKYVDQCKKNYKDIKIETEDDTTFSFYSGHWYYSYTLNSLELDKDLYFENDFKFEQ